MPQKDKDGERIVRITVDLPESLWKAAKLRAVHEGRPLRAIIIELMVRYLRQRPSNGEGKR